jgi:hypothetical protein
MLVTGCAGPEKKLGRGLANITEIARGGEMARSFEQTTLWEGGQKAHHGGFDPWVQSHGGAHGDRCGRGGDVLSRRGRRMAEWTYDAVYTPDGPLYPDYSVATYTEPFGGMRLTEYPATPDSYHHAWQATSALDTDGHMGITGGAIIPFFPFGKFQINEQ